MGTHEKIFTETCRGRHSSFEVSGGFSFVVKQNIQNVLKFPLYIFFFLCHFTHNRNGTLDLLMSDAPILDYYRATDHGCELKKIGDIFVEDTYAIGMKKG